MNDPFRYRSPDFAKLQAYGFERESNIWRYNVRILDGAFDLYITIAENGAVETELIDVLTGEPYTLHLLEGAAGEFVGSVRAAYEQALEEIARSCYYRDVFASAQAHEVFAYAKRVYGDEPEYLWEKFPDCAVLRRKDNSKWYAVIIGVARKKVGLSGEGNVALLDLRMAPEEIVKTVGTRGYVGGWHMNKKSWVGIPLDDTLTFSEISARLDESYRLAKK